MTKPVVRQKVLALNNFKQTNHFLNYCVHERLIAESNFSFFFPDKRIVKEAGSEADVWWGRVNIPMEVCVTVLWNMHVACKYITLITCVYNGLFIHETGKENAPIFLC